MAKLSLYMTEQHAYTVFMKSRTPIWFPNNSNESA